MASLTSIRAGIGTNLGNITSLIVYNHVPDFVEPPTAVVGVVDIIEFDTSMKRGADRYEIPVFVYVSRVDAQDSQETLDSYLASTGANSIKTPPIVGVPIFFIIWSLGPSFLIGL